MSKILKIGIAIFVVVILVGIGIVVWLSRGLETVSALDINDVNLTALSDGTYTGSYQYGRWDNEVMVKVKDHQIVDIELTEDVTFSKPEVIDELFHRVLDEQKTTVDVVASSTVTSKAYLKAIEDALTQ